MIIKQIPEDKKQDCKCNIKAVKRERSQDTKESIIGKFLQIIPLILPLPDFIFSFRNFGDEIIRLWIVSQHWRLDSWKDECYPDQALRV